MIDFMKYCNGAQTRKLYKLGAPIVTSKIIPSHLNRPERFTVINNNLTLCNPTIDSVCEWLYAKYNIFIGILYDEHVCQFISSLDTKVNTKNVCSTMTSRYYSNEPSCSKSLAITDALDILEKQIFKTVYYQPILKQYNCVPDDMFSNEAFRSRELCYEWLRKNGHDIEDFDIVQYSTNDIPNIIYICA